MASATEFSQLMVAGANSGSGKTTLTLGLLWLCRRAGLRVRPFKCGPDYLDGMLHRQAAGIDSINLDGYFGNLAAFGRYAAGMDAAVVEGAMGLFDGIRPGELAGSSAEVAAELGLPVILTVNVRGLAGSLAPLVKGFADWYSRVRIIGVFASQAGSARHGESLREILAVHRLPPLLGYLVRDERRHLPERHLGLTAEPLPESFLDELADELEKSVRLEQLRELTSAPCPAARQSDLPPVRRRLGVALDDAFSFYYRENFDLLREQGVECVFFSPLGDTGLPAGLDGLYFGGGYPELHAARLAANAPMLAAIREFAARRPVYGECGGYLYMLEGLADFDGKFHPMLNLLPGRAVMNSKLAALGYREVNGRWGSARGHEFHYSSLSAAPPEPHLWTAVDGRGNPQSCGGVRGRACGSYIHLHFASSPELLRNFIGELER